MDEESGYDAGSEATLPSLHSEISLSDYRIKKPCEICGNNANENQLVTCFFCRVTREHTYCMKVFQRFVPAVWMCEECHSDSPVRTNQVVHSVDQTATSPASTNQVVDDNEDSIDQTPNSITNQVVDNEVVHQNMSTSDSYDQISVTHQPSSHAHTIPVVGKADSPVPMDTSLVKGQMQPDSNLPSDSESVN